MQIFRRNRSSQMKARNPPLGMKWRSSKYYIVLVTGMGLFTDVCLFPLFSPAIPARLEDLGYQGDVASMAGWLNAAYAAGLILSTFPFTWLGARTNQKRNILLGALVLMAVGVLLFLLVENYAAMVAARILQGASGSGVWILGLALVADNVEQTWLGRGMGLAMIGYSFGTAVGLPIGGVLSGTLGWKAPSVFALCLIGVDFCLRVMVLEKHEVKRWTSTPQDPLQLEPTKSRDPVEAAGETIAIVPNDLHVGDMPQRSDADVETTDAAEKAMTQDKTQTKAAQPQYDSLKAIAYLLFHGRPLTGIAISFLNGFLVSGMYNTALVLRLYQRYGLDELHAGYVFFAVAVPAAITSPFAGYLCDRIGPRPLSMLCCSAFAPVLLLLIIEQLPLAAFAVILCFSGMCSGLINAPVMVLFGYIAANSDGVVGTSHCYGAFNLSFSLSAFIGPIVAGQILQATGTPTGFKIQIGLTAGLALLCVPLAYIYMRMTRPQKASKSMVDAA